MTTQMNEETISELLCWINSLENALSDIYEFVISFFAEEIPKNRRQLLDCVVSQRQIWGERPTVIIRELYEKERE